MESLEKFEFEATPNIEFLDGVAVISRLTVRNSDAVGLLRKMDALEVEYLVDSLLTTVAKVAEGTATAEAVMTEFREQIQSKTREEFECFRKEIEGKLKSFDEEMAKDLKQLFEDSFKGISEGDKRLDKKIEKIEEKLRDKLEEILKRILVEEKQQEIKEKTTLKGLDFQRAVYEECRLILESTEETVDYVADKQGARKRKTGDVVVKHVLYNGLAPRTVVECKDKDMSNSSAEEILAEIKEALANRGADACLYVFKHQEQMPESLRPIKIGTNFVVASCDINLGILLRIAKLVGGVECRLRRNETEADIESTKSELKNILSFIEDLSEIQRLSLLASQHSQKVSEKAGGLKLKIENSENKALESLTGGD